MNVEKVKNFEGAAVLRNAAENAVYFLLGLLVCRGMVFGELAPFGASYTAAVSRKKLFWALCGTAVGYIALKPHDAFRYVAVTVSVALVRWLLQDIKSLSRSALFAPAAAFVPVFASGLVMLFSSASTLTDISTVLIEALLAAAAAYFISRSLFLAETRRGIASFSQSELSCIVMTACVLMLSLGSLELEGVSPGRILAVTAIMICARYGGVVGGSIAGICAGSVFGISGAGMVYLAAGYAFGGLLGGLFSVTGKLGTAVGFVISNAVMLLTANPEGYVLPMFVETLIAATVFMFLPSELERYVTPLFLPKESTKGERALRNSVVMRLDFAANALRNVSGCVNTVSRELAHLYAPSVDRVFENASEEVCKNCGLRAYCHEHHRGELREDFSRLSAPLKAQGFVTENDVETLFTQKCCRAPELADEISRGYRDYIGGMEAAARVGQVRSMVAGQFSGLSEILGDMAAEFENYKSYDADSSARVVEYLHGEGYVPMECGCMIDAEGRMTVEIQLSNTRLPLRKSVLAQDISEICGRCFDTPVVVEIGTQKRVVLNEIPMYDIEVGVFQHVSGGGKLCGDCVKCFSGGFGRFVALISDGMGTGGRAAVDSNMTVSILTRLLKAGLSEDCALSVVNSALMIKSEDESLSTVDLAEVDLFSGKLTLYKAGAPLTLIKKGGHILKKSASSLPIGILGSVKLSCETVNLSGGDVIVMISDGALVGDEKWLEALVRKYSGGRCSDLAKEVVNEAIKRRNDGHDDDITAVAVKLIDTED